MDGKCASRSNVYPYTSCCVLDIHFVLKNNFCVNLFDGNLILLCILFVFFLDICTILFILCKKQTNKTKQLMLFIFYPIRRIIWGWRAGCACVYARRVNDGEACVGRATENGLNLLLCVFYSLSSSWGTGFDSECIAVKNKWLFHLKKKKERHLNATCSLLRNQTFANLSEGQLVNVELNKVRRFRSTPEWQFGFI